MSFSFRSRVRLFLISALIIVLIGIGWGIWSGTLLERMGLLLVKDMEPTQSDAVVIIRGDVNFSRALTAWSLFRDGLVSNIIIPAALEDESVRRLSDESVSLPTMQENLKSILIQKGVPEDRIILDRNPPGGGTEGEALRIKAVAAERSFQSLLAVTSWFHTRRTQAILSDCFAGTGVRVRVFSALNDVSGPRNWWRYRYQAVYVLEEYAKWMIRLILPDRTLGFADDPPPPKESTQ